MQKALSNLKTSLQRVRNILADIDANAGLALRDPDVFARHQTVLCAATVILSGFLESFIREVAQEMVDEVCSRGVPFNDLPRRVRSAHYLEGSKVLLDFGRRERDENPLTHSKAADVVRRLASVAGGGTPYEIVWEAFADTQANPGPDQIGAFLKRFDIDKPFETLSQEVNITHQTLSLRLKSFIEVRNECAHTGTSPSQPTTTNVTDYCDLLETIGDGVVRVFQVRLSRHPFLPPAPILQQAVDSGAR